MNSKSYLKGYKSALSNLAEVVSESNSKNDVIARIHRENEWVLEALMEEEKKDKAWEALLESIDKATAITQINIERGNE